MLQRQANRTVPPLLSDLLPQIDELYVRQGAIEHTLRQLQQLAAAGLGTVPALE